jgi:hypothetical protein
MRCPKKLFNIISKDFGLFNTQQNLPDGDDLIQRWIQVSLCFTCEFYPRPNTM